MVQERLWFSHWTKEYRTRQGAKGMVFEWLEDRPEIKMDWDNCTVGIVGHPAGAGMARFVVRSQTSKNSQYMGNIPVRLRFMFTLDADARTIAPPVLERNYRIASPLRKRVPQSVRDTPHDRWVMNLGDGAEVWEWTRAGRDIKESAVWQLYEEIRLFVAMLAPANIFRASVEELDRIVPVIYQPAVDSLDNFLREIHCAAKVDGDSADVAVSLVFNNEHLRKFAIADGIYRWLRRLIYGRQIDIETFIIHFVRSGEEKEKKDDNNNYFMFAGIYSGDYGLQYDTIHLDKVPEKRKVEYYFADLNHPVVFVNTSNHALAPHDNNRSLWKWEYVPWVEKSPVVLGTKTRAELDRQFRSIFG